MIKITSTLRLPVKTIDKHLFICDLVNLEGPILSLFRHKNQNWLYLWCDTNGTSTERWLLFPVSRADLVSYLEKQSPLRYLVTSASKHLVLDQSFNADEKEKATGAQYRSLKQLSVFDEITEYLPAHDSFFDDALAPDISLANELSPTKYDVPISGDWFFADLDAFSRLYSQLYAFFYCTKPRFVNNLGKRVEKYLGAPWKGGFSRVNLFDALYRFIPSLHDLQIKKIRYASPGEINIEALKSVGDSISAVVLRYAQVEKEMLDAEKAINTVLGTSKLKRVDLSELNDKQLPIDLTKVEFLKMQHQLVAESLGVADEVAQLASFSPNVVVTSKVVLSLLVRIKRLSELQKAGQLDLTRSETQGVN